MSRKTKRYKMKQDTHSKQEIEAKLIKELNILKDPNVGKERKKEARITAKRYERLLRDVDFKEVNGKDYPNRLYHSGYEPMNVKEILKLIDSVSDSLYFGVDHYPGTIPPKEQIKSQLDLSGVSPGENRFTFKEMGKVRTSIFDVFVYNKNK